MNWLASRTRGRALTAGKPIQLWMNFCTTDLDFDDDDLLGHIALLFAACVHDAKQCVGTKGVGGEAKLVGPILEDRGFSSCSFWDILRSDRFIELRAFLFADPFE